MSNRKYASVLVRNGFVGYFGPGYHTHNAGQSFMDRYPRGKGIKGHEKDKLELYEACLSYQQERSRTANYSTK